MTLRSIYEAKVHKLCVVQVLQVSTAVMECLVTVESSPDERHCHTSVLTRRNGPAQVPFDAENVQVQTPPVVENDPVQTPPTADNFSVQTPPDVENVPVQTPPAAENVPAQTPTNMEIDPAQTAAVVDSDAARAQFKGGRGRTLVSLVRTFLVSAIHVRKTYSVIM